MAQATETTRRAVLAGAAIPATALPLAAVGAEPDPIYAAIEAHKAAERALAEAVNASDIPNETPGYAELNAATDKASDETIAAAFRLLDVTPTTMAGLLALLRYAAEYVNTPRADNEWPQPEYYEFDGPTDYLRTWEATLFARTAERLAGGALA